MHPPQLHKGMVLTVGTGTGPATDIVTPLLKSVREARPDAVACLVSPQSAPLAQTLRERLAREAGYTPPVWETFTVADPNDLELAFTVALTAIRSLLRQGLAPADITADYTSGTKAMTAALVLAAVALGCGSLRYITGQRRDGTVVAGTERFLTLPPSAVLAFNRLQVAEELFRQLAFGACRHLVSEVNLFLLTPDDQHRREALLQAAQAYDAWDRFQYHDAVHWFERLLRTHPAVLPADLYPASDLPRRLRHLGDTVHQKRFTRDLLADLLANAERRLREGRWDDAVARLYRATEMLAQWILHEEYRVDPSALDPARLPPEIAADYTPGQKLGLLEGYTLIARLETTPARKTDLGRAFAESALPHLLTVRNESLLAHGTRPVTREAAHRFFGELVRVASTQIDDLPTRIAAWQFPWLQTSSGQQGP